MKNELAGKITLNDVLKENDGAVKDTDGNKKTNDAGNYTWTGTVKLDDSLTGNYELETGTVTAASNVDQATLTVTLNDIARTYGDATIKDGKTYAAGKVEGVVNGDTYGPGDITISKTSDGAVDNAGAGRVTNDAKDAYEWMGTASSTNATLNKNYKLEVKGAAKSKVDKAALSLDLNDVKRIYGNTNITEGSYSLKDYEGKLVNGDKGTIAFDSDKAKASDGGLVENGTKTNDVKEGGYTWKVENSDLTGNGLNLDNYEITVGTGKSFITPKEVSLKDLTASIVYGSKDGISSGSIGLKEGDVVYGDDVTVSGTASIRENSEYTANKSSRDTADVGSYENSLKVDNAELKGTKAGNYKLVGDANGTIDVTKAKLTVNLNDVAMTYGDAETKHRPSYGYKASEEAGKNLVNGDKLTDVITGMGYTNTGFDTD